MYKYGTGTGTYSIMNPDMDPEKERTGPLKSYFKKKISCFEELEVLCGS
jgi:hypothetical protein